MINCDHQFGGAGVCVICGDNAWNRTGLFAISLTEPQRHRVGQALLQSATFWLNQAKAESDKSLREFCISKAISFQEVLALFEAK